MPLRLDKFLQDHISFITGSINIIRAKLVYNDLDTTNQKENVETITDEETKKEDSTSVIPVVDNIILLRIGEISVMI